MGNLVVSALNLAVAAGIGLGVGWLCERLPLSPSVQTVTAGVFGVLLASIAVAVLWIMASPPPLHIRAVSFGIMESGIALGVSAVLSIALHHALPFIAAALGLSALETHRGLVVGVLAAILAATWFSLGLGVAGTVES